MRSIRRKFCGLALLLIALAASGCTGGGKHSAPLFEQQQVPQAAHFALPAPSTLLQQSVAETRGRGGSYVQADLFKEGSGFEQNIPGANVTASNNIATYSPSFTGSAADLSGLAWAVYRFQAEGYDLAPLLRLEWSGDAPEHGAVWLGVSRWAGDRWHFAAFDEQWRADFGSVEESFSSSDVLLAAVLVTGSVGGELKSLRLAGAAPVAVLEVSPQQGPPPLSVTLDASASQPGEGEIVEFAWDYDSDGVFDSFSGTDGTVEVLYEEAGEYLPSVRVTNDAGISSTIFGAAVRVSGFWQHSYGGPGTDSVSGIEIDPAGGIYVAGGFDGTEEDEEGSAMLLRLDSAGQLLWAREYQEDQQSSYFDICLDSNGQPVLLGSSTDAQCDFIQRWSADGEMLSHKLVFRGGGETTNLTEIHSAGDMLLVGGRHRAGNALDLIAFCLNAEDSLEWSYLYRAPATQYCHDCESLYDAFNGAQGLALAGYTESSLPLLVEVGMDGELLRSQSLSLPDYPDRTAWISTALFYDDFIGDPVYHLAGVLLLSDSERSVFVLSIGAEGSSSAGQLIDGPGDIHTMCFDGAGRLALMGRSFGGISRAWLGSMSLPMLGLQDSKEYFNSDDVNFYWMQQYGEGLLIGGSAPDAQTFSLNALAETEALSAEWIPFEVEQLNASLVYAANAPGLVTDLAPLLTADEGGGYDDAAISYIARPE